jgi:hypothetical protein
LLASQVKISAGQSSGSDASISPLEIFWETVGKTLNNVAILIIYAFLTPRHPVNGQIAH